MELLQRGDSRVKKIIWINAPDPGKKYRLSRWVFLFRKDGAVVLRSSLTKEIRWLDEAEWSAVRGGDPSDPAVGELIRQGFLVEEGADEYARYSLVSAVLRSLEPRKNGVEIFTILPTTGCNARCVYCYQEGIAVKSMSADVADRVVEYVSAHKAAGKVKLHWFGGEPLCAAGVISRICRGLREKGAEYVSDITTNGSLFTPELIREAVGLWSLESAQISMDGAREDYEARKRFFRPDLHNYGVVMDNVRQLAEAGVTVTIRCNYDLDNLQGVHAFLDECESRFGGNGKVRVVPSLLLQETWSPSRRTDAASELEALAEHAAKLGHAARKPRLPDTFRYSQCMADSRGRNVIIDPAGGLFTCDYYVGGEPLGSIFDETPPVWPTAPAPAEECADCCFLPDCTATFKKVCPFCPPDCRELARKNTERCLEELLQGPPEPASGETDAPPCG